MANSNDQLTKIVKGEKNKTPAKNNSVETLLNRSIKFRKSRYVDQKLELFKQKFNPINGATGVVYSSSAYNQSETSTAEKIDANGFESPSKTLFPVDKLDLSWLNIHPIGPGLKDLGHLSSLNAVLQTLTYTPSLANYFLERKHSLNCASQEHCFACQVENHIRTALNGNNYALQPRVFVGKLKQLKDVSTKDVYNIWNYFAQQIQGSLVLEKGSKDKLVQQTTALCQIFGGYIQNKLECPSCKKVENKYDFFMDLSLDLLQCSTLDRCLSKHFKEQISVEAECPSCQHEGQFQGKQSIYKLPKVLAIQLKRFSSADGSSKINKQIKFEPVLDINRIVTESESKQVKSKYELYSIITHTGESIHNGHYVSYVKSSNGIWYCMDNENVQQVSLNRLLNEKASMLFYRIVSEPVKRKKIQPEIRVKAKQTEEEKEENEVKIEEENQEELLEDYIKEESDDEERMEKEKLKVALDEAATKEKVENRAAIVVSHNENMKSKRDKLQELIDKENQESKSSEVKQALLLKTLDNQFQDSISTWDEDVGTAVESQRKQLLKKLKPKRKKTDFYDLEYDTGKVKKVKNKQEDKFHKPNMFQITADMKQNKRK